MSIKLAELLPAPVSRDAHENTPKSKSDPWFNEHEESLEHAATSKAIVMKEPPAYGHRKDFVPRSAEDFGDGGAFPEIHIAQFPLGMGRDSADSHTTSKTVALQYDSDGKLRHDAIARIGHDKDKIIYSRLADMKAKVIDEEDESLKRADDDEVEQVTEVTRQALEKIVSTKIASALPVQHAQKQAPAQYIRYTPSQQSGTTGGEVKQRIIRMVEEQKDPMEPPRFKINQKIPRAPPSPPAPVMHSPTRKVTAKEQADWKIPPCISNWKNPKGYTVALDKRLSADGRGLQQVHINENFAKMAEALSIAERKAREAVEARSQMELRIAQNKKAEKEKQMREIATKARMERLEMKKGHGDEHQQEEVKEREAIRRNRLDDFRKERNIARGHPDKLERLRQEKDRDISEKIALGLPDSRARSGDTQFDQRLFGQSSGLDSGGINDETYGAYDKPWRPQDNIQQHIYRPSKGIDSNIYGEDLDRIINTNRFVADRGFAGAESESAAAGASRSGPVQFERDQEEDIFGLGELLQTSGGKSESRGPSSSYKRAGEGESRDSKRSRH